MTPKRSAGESTSGLVVRTLSRTADVAWFVGTALPVLVATIGGGWWLGTLLLDAALGLLDHRSGAGLLRLLMALAGVIGVLIVFRAWCALLRRQDSSVGRSRWQVVTVAVLATIATFRIAATTHTEASRFQQLADQPPVMHTNWFPAVLMGAIATSAALLMLVPGRAVVELDRVQRRHRVGPRLRVAVRVAGDLLAFAGLAIFAWLARAVPGVRAGLARLASRLWPPMDVRLGVFLLMLPPVRVAIVPVAVTLLLFCGFTVFFFGIATVVAPPALVAALLALAVLLVLVAGYVATLRLWVALCRDTGAARQRTRGPLVALAALWITRPA